MSRHYSFTEFLREKCESSGGYEGAVDDDYEERFEHWLEYVDVAQVIEWGDQYGRLTGATLPNSR